MVALADAPAVPQSRLVEAWRTVGPAVVELLREEKIDPARPVVGLHWTVSQLGAHLVSTVEFGIDVLHGKGSPLTTLNSADLAAINLSYIDAVLRAGRRSGRASGEGSRRVAGSDQ